MFRHRHDGKRYRFTYAREGRNMPVILRDANGDAAEAVTLVVRLPTDLDAALREYAVREDRTLAQVVRIALRRFLDA